MPRRTVVDPRFPSRLRELRKARGLSHGDVARAAYLARSYISELENAKKSPGVDTARVLDDALQADGELKRMVVEPDDHPTDSSDPDPLALAALITRSSMPLQLIDHFERTALAQVARYPSTPARDMWPVVRSQISHLGGALSAPQTLHGRRRLMQVMGILAGLAGHAAADLDRPARACEYFSLSRLAADEADDADLAAWGMGLHGINAIFWGSLSYAGNLLDEATSIARPASSTRRRSWLTALRSRAYAAIGDQSTARACLDEAHALMQEVDVERGTDFFNQDRLEGMTGTTYLLLRDPMRATDSIGRALQRRPPTEAKGRALLVLDKAACHIVEDEPEEALATVHRALDLACGQFTTPIVVRAREIRGDVARLDDTKAIRQLDERLMEISHDIHRRG